MPDTSPFVRRTLRVGGRRECLRLRASRWEELDRMAAAERTSVGEIVTRKLREAKAPIDKEPPHDDE